MSSEAIVPAGLDEDGFRITGVDMDMYGFRVVGAGDGEIDEDGMPLVAEGEYAVVSGWRPQDRVCLSGGLKRMQELTAALVARFGLPDGQQVLLYGNPVNGMTVHGPVDTGSDAWEECEEKFGERRDDWWLTELRPLGEVL